MIERKSLKESWIPDQLRDDEGEGDRLDAQQQPRIAVLLPCYNEEAAIAATVAGFKTALPGATVYVYDNNSRDRTREVAARAGAVVRTERLQGKGHVVMRMFADIDADVYVMADGFVGQMMEPVEFKQQPILPEPPQWSVQGNAATRRRKTEPATPASHIIRLSHRHRRAGPVGQ